MPWTKIACAAWTPAWTATSAAGGAAELLAEMARFIRNAGAAGEESARILVKFRQFKGKGRQPFPGVLWQACTLIGFYIIDGNALVAGTAPESGRVVEALTARGQRPGCGGDFWWEGIPASQV